MKPLTAFLLAMFMIAAPLSVLSENVTSAGVAPVTPFWDGTGTSGDPYQISNVTELQWMGNASNLGKHFILVADIDASATVNWSGGFQPVGTDAARFTGTFNGNGYVIKNLYINRTTTDYVGLFGAANNAALSWVILHNASVSGKQLTGILVGKTIGTTTISNCSSSGYVSGTLGVGGLVGDHSSSGILGYSYSTAQVDAEDMGGGLAGYVGNAGSVRYCYAAGDVDCTRDVGGLVGLINIGSVYNSYATGNVHGDWRAGGLIGRKWGNVVNSYSSGQVTAKWADEGGLVAVNESGTVTNCFWDVDTSGVATTAGGGTGLSTADMMTQTTFTAVTWDFTNVWWMVTGQTRPFLRWEYSTEIRNSHQLQLMQMNLTADYTLANDIDLSDITEASQMWGTNSTQGGGFVPVAYDTDPGTMNFDGTMFTGTFDGKGHSVTGLFINRSTRGFQGLFGCIFSSAKLENVNMVGVNITGDYFVGGLYGANNNLGAASNVTVSGSIRGNQYLGGLTGQNTNNAVLTNISTNMHFFGGQYVGGIAGRNAATITGCDAQVIISNAVRWVGGIAGNNAGSIINSNASGQVEGNTNYIGGIVGINAVTGNIMWCGFIGHVGGDTATEVGGVIGTNFGIVENCSFEGWVNTTNSYVGGIAGHNTGTVNNSHATGKVNGATNIGGLVGWNEYGSVNNSYAAGEVIGTSDYVGGLIGTNRGPVENCHAFGSVNGSEYVGGLIGENRGNITRCSASGNVTGIDDVGGLCGIIYLPGSISMSYAAGKVTATGNGVGGLVGNQQSSDITNCYATGDVDGSAGGGGVGGLIGASYAGNITHCYSTGYIDGGFMYNGGLIGYTAAPVIVTECHWDNETSGTDTGIGSGSNPEVTGHVTAEMKQQSTFDPPWDFTTIWWIRQGITYPLLRALNLPPVRNVDLDRYYATIQEAIEDMETDNGHTITVSAGTYLENVLVNKRLTIIGNGSANTTIDGSGTGNTVQITANWVNLTGFTLMGSGNDSWADAGLSLHTSNNCTISDVNSSGNSLGLALTLVYDCVITQCNLSKNYFNEDDGEGINIRYSHRNVISHNTFHDNKKYGIRVENECSGNVISHNTFVGSLVGIDLMESPGNAISENQMHDNWQAIHIHKSNNTAISSNNIFNNSGAIHIQDSANATVSGNIMEGNGIYLDGQFLEQWNTHTIGIDNKVNGKDVHYIKNQTSGTVPAGAGQVILANCTNMKIENQNLSRSTTGIALGFSDNNTIANNTANHNVQSIRLFDSHGNRLENNTASFNSVGGFDEMGIGILLLNSHLNVLANNTANDNDVGGIVLFGTVFNTLIGNRVANNSGGLVLDLAFNTTVSENTVLDSAVMWPDFWVDVIPWDGSGIFVSGQFNNLEGNIITGCEANGILMYGSPPEISELKNMGNNTIHDNILTSNDRSGIHILESNNNTVFSNQISQNGHGMFLNNSNDSKIHHNRFMNNVAQAFDNGTNNIWHEAATLEGNFWSDYRVLHPSALTSDGVTWDTPYAITGGAQDLHPLTGLTVDSIVIVDTPLTSQTAIADTQAGAGFSITGYAAAFNGTDYIGDIAVTWTVQNFTGATAWISANGNTSTFHVGNTTGYAHWTASYHNGMELLTYTVNMTCDPVPPTANAGLDQSVAQNQPVTFNGSGSSDTSGIANYTWNFTYNGTAVALYEVSPTYSFWTPGIYNVTLTVADTFGNQATDTMVVTVNDVTGPMANAGPDQAVNAGTIVTFNGGSSTDNVLVTNYTWAFTHNGSAVTLYGASPTFRFWETDNHTVTLTVRDAAGNTDIDTMVVTVTVIPPAADTTPPVADAGPDQTVGAGTLVTFTGAGSSDNVGITNYTWNFTFGGSAVKLYGVSPEFNFTIAGIYSVTLTVKDAASNTGVDTMTVTVNTLAPAADTTSPVADAGPDQTVNAGTLVTFTGAGSSDNVGIANYTWSFTYNGTAIPLYGISPTFRFWTAANYTLTLTVSDAAGNTDTDTMLVTVNAAAGPGDTDDTDEDGEPGSYLWIIIILILVIVVALLAFMKMGKGKTPADMPEEDTPTEVGSAPEDASTEESASEQHE
ncbi:MAG: PKD domain-containing protein [Thermoplasmata archaeon]